MEDCIGISSYTVVAISQEMKCNPIGIMESYTANWLQTAISDHISQSMSQKQETLEVPWVTVRRTHYSRSSEDELMKTLSTMYGPERRQAYSMLSQKSALHLSDVISRLAQPTSTGLESDRNKKKPSKEMVAWTMRAICLGDYIDPKQVAELIESVKKYGCE